MSDHEKKDEWWRHGKDFMVMVKHYTVEHAEDGKHRWNVYAYIYPKHPHFSAFVGDHMWQDAAACLPFHGGPTMLRRHYNEKGETISVQVGSDYHHLYDDRFAHFANEADAYEVFSDADALYERLSPVTSND